MAKKLRKNGHHRHTLGLLEAIYGALSEDRFSRADQAHEAYHSFRAKARAQRSSLEAVADSITSTFGSIRFAVAHLFWFGGWILLNTGFFPGIPVFDPFPFGLLTMVVSLEAIFLSIFVLISQNRESVVSDLRDEMNFQITVQSEQEITKLLKLVSELHTHAGLTVRKDTELESMKKKLNPDQLEATIKREVDEAS